MQLEKKINVKRTVAIKAIVTEDFKKYLKHELLQAKLDLEEKLSDVLNQGKILIGQLRQQGHDDQAKTIEQQIEFDKQQQENAKQDIEKRLLDVDNLALGSEFEQGTIESFVSIKEGDNLYEKIGACELVVKDGIILSIRGE